MKFKLCESIEYDSEGNPLTQEQIEFFKNSKVRDSQGRLLVCYHGTRSNFDIFDRERTKVGNLGKGFYFITKKGLEKRFGDLTKACYLNIETPYTSNEKSEWETSSELLRKYRNIGSLHDVQDLLSKDGYDGIIANDWDVGGEIKIVVAFNPNQIKSIDNKNPTNSDSINEDLNTTTEQQLIDTIQDMEDEDDEIYIGDIDGGSTLLVSKNGDVLIADSWDNHADFLDAVAKKIGFKGHLYDYVTEQLGWVTLNNGFGFGDDRFKIVVPKKPTQKQLRAIENWLDLYNDEEYHTGDLVLYANGLTKWIYRDLYTSKDIIKKINKAFQFGILEKKKK